MPLLLGPNNSILHLILMKSGTHVDIESPTIIATEGQEMIKINVVGPPNLVTLVGQMIQEVLINGPEKLVSLPDMPQMGAGYEESLPSFPEPLPHTGSSRLGRGKHSTSSFVDLARESYGYHQPPGRQSQGATNSSSYSSVEYGNMIHEQPVQSAHQYTPGNQIRRNFDLLYLTSFIAYNNTRSDFYSREYNPQQSSASSGGAINGQTHGQPLQVNTSSRSA